MADILHLTHAYRPVSGGTATRLYNLLEKSIFSHDVVTPSGIGNQSEIEILGSVTVHRVGGISRTSTKSSLLKRAPNHYKRMILVHKICREKTYKIVHAHNPLSYALSATYLANIKHLPLVYEIHRYVESPFNTLLRPYEFIKKYLERYLLHRADAIILQTPEAAKWVTKRYSIQKQKIYIIPMGIDLTQFEKDGLYADIPALTGKNLSNKKIILYNGHLEKINGAHCLVKAFRDLPPEFKKRLHLVVLGHGSFKREIVKLSREYPDLVSFLGEVEHKDIAPYYRAASACIIPLPDHPCWHRNIPTKLIEAMALEKAVIAPSLKAITNYISPNEGYLYRSDIDGLSLMVTLKNFALSHSSSSSMTINLRDKVKSLDWTTLRKKLDSIYLNYFSFT